MKIYIDTIQRSIQIDRERIYFYNPGSPLHTAIMVVEKLIKVHIRSERQGSIVTTRTR